MVCNFFKQGICQKGDRCKFSHDITVERKAEKRNIYADVRDGQEGDKMENWDEKKLDDVINQKHGEDNKKKNTTQIVISVLLKKREKVKNLIFFKLKYRSVNISSKLLKIKHTAGFGVVLMVINACTAMRYRLDLC